MSASTVEIEKLLWETIDPEKCVLRFDSSLVDDLPFILKERYSVSTVAEAFAVPLLAKLMQALDMPESASLSELPSRIAGAGVDKSKFRLLAKSEILGSNERVFDRWSMKTSADEVDAVVALQRDLGMGRYNNETSRHDPIWPGGNLKQYMRGVTTVPPTLFQRLVGYSYWELRIKWWKLRGLLRSDLPSLSIGPRWVTEIQVFREILGLEKHIGLDLFSDDAGLVIAGDMHAMPFPDGNFQLVFIKNTVDKSYDFRQLVREIVRVSRPGAIVVIDQISGYGDCSPLTRTDIQRAENLVRVFRSQCQREVRVLVQEDVALSEVPGAMKNDRAKYNSRIAIRI